tara:strand:- start:1115 stop:3409 length:2295 start_codon:yes stop_codon:yes gene_type:complete
MSGSESKRKRPFRSNSQQNHNFDHQQCGNNEIDALITLGARQHMYDKRGMQPLLLCTMLNHGIRDAALLQIRLFLDALNNIKNMFVKRAADLERRVVTFLDEHRHELPNKVRSMSSQKLYEHFHDAEDRNQAPFSDTELNFKDSFVAESNQLNGIADEYTDKLKMVASDRRLWNQPPQIASTLLKFQPEAITHIFCMRERALTDQPIYQALVDGSYEMGAIAATETMYTEVEFSQTFCSAVAFRICMMCAGAGKCCKIDPSSSYAAGEFCHNFTAHKPGLFLIANEACVCKNVFSPTYLRYNQCTDLKDLVHDMIALHDGKPQELKPAPVPHNCHFNPPFWKQRAVALQLREHGAIDQRGLVPGLLVDYNRFFYNHHTLRETLGMSSQDFEFVKAQHKQTIASDLKMLDFLKQVHRQHYQTCFERFSKRAVQMDLNTLEETVPGAIKTLNLCVKLENPIFKCQRFRDVQPSNHVFQSIWKMPDTHKRLFSILNGPVLMHFHDRDMFGIAGCSSPHARAFLFGTDVHWLRVVTIQGHPLVHQMHKQLDNIHMSVAGGVTDCNSASEDMSRWRTGTRNGLILVAHVFDRMGLWDVSTTWSWQEKTERPGVAHSGVSMNITIVPPGRKSHELKIPVSDLDYQTTCFRHMLFLKALECMKLESAQTVIGVLEEYFPGRWVWKCKKHNSDAVEELNSYYTAVVRSMNLFPELRGLLFWFCGARPPTVVKHIVQTLIRPFTVIHPFVMDESRVRKILDTLEVADEENVLE